MSPSSLLYLLILYLFVFGISHDDFLISRPYSSHIVPYYNCSSLGGFATLVPLRRRRRMLLFPFLIIINIFYYTSVDGSVVSFNGSVNGCCGNSSVGSISSNINLGKYFRLKSSSSSII